MKVICLNSLMRRCIFALLLLVARAEAFEIFPEYHHLDDTEFENLERPSAISSEYRSDVLAYTQPLSWYEDLISSQRYADFSLGSLNGKRFLTNHKVKISGDMDEKWNMRIIYMEQADFEDEIQQILFEMRYKISEKWALALYGVPSTRKSEDDAGLALLYRFNKNHQLRLYHTWVDFSLNERNVDSDFYDKKPIATGFSGLWQGEKKFIEYHLRVEPRSRRVFPDEGKTYRYQKFYSAVKTRFGSIYADLEVGNKFEGNQFPSNVSNNEDWNRNFVDARVQYNKNKSIYGLASYYRHWTSNLGSVTQNQLLPYYWYQLTPSWQLGYEFTWHRGGGTRTLRNPEDGDNVLEHRFNLSYQVVFSESARLHLLFTADLDEFGTGRTWEGGNGQFQWLF